MAVASPDPPAKPRRKTRRWLLIILLGAIAVGALLAFAPPFALLRSAEEPPPQPPPPPTTAPPVKRAPFALGIEYHYDRNAIVDSRLMGDELVALAAAGNLIVFDAGNFQVRREKIFHRRVTCLGPAEQGQVMAGLANGAIVRVAQEDLSVRPALDVPGRPFWIGKRRAGGLLVAYQVPGEHKALLLDDAKAQTYALGDDALLFVDSKDRLWSGGREAVHVLDLREGSRRDLAWKSGWPGLRGFVELTDGQVWAFGGADAAGDMTSYIVRVAPGAKPTVLLAGKRRPTGAPTLAVTHVLEDRERSRLVVVSQDTVSLSDRALSSWQPLDAMIAGRHDDDALLPLGQAHLAGARVVLTSARKGFLEVAADSTRRHQLDHQYAVVRPSAIVRLAGGMAFYGDGGPLFYKGGTWQALPDPIVPPPELMGPARAGEKERAWAAMVTLPIDADASYVIAKAGPPRHYVGHLHGLRDVLLTARWDGSVLTVLGHEELPIEPDDTFSTPDRQLWNVDDQGLWSFSGGHWRLVMRAKAVGSDKAVRMVDVAEAPAHAHLRSAIGEPLHFAESWHPPFYGLPSAGASWALVRLDSNEAGGVPLIDEVSVKLERDRLLLRDLTSWGTIGEDLLLATDRGLCVFSVKWGNCSLIRPDGLRDEVTLFMRDGTKRLWLGGRGLWVLRDRQHADAVHTSLPMLADTRVVALAEAPDGRLIIGLEDRGAIFLSIPQGWFLRAPESSTPIPAWDANHPHEAVFADSSLVMRACGESGTAAARLQRRALVTSLRELAQKQGGRVRVEEEEVFDRLPDLAVRGGNLQELLDGVLPLLDGLDGKGHWRVLKRFGPPGADAVEVRACRQ